MSLVLNVFFNKIYTYEHLTPALWFDGAYILLLSGSLSVMASSTKNVKNYLYGNGKPK